MDRQGGKSGPAWGASIKLLLRRSPFQLENWVRDKINKKASLSGLTASQRLTPCTASAGVENVRVPSRGGVGREHSLPWPSPHQPGRRGDLHTGSVLGRLQSVGRGPALPKAAGSVCGFSSQGLRPRRGAASQSWMDPWSGSVADDSSRVLHGLHPWSSSDDPSTPSIAPALPNLAQREGCTPPPGYRPLLV